MSNHAAWREIQTCGICSSLFYILTAENLYPNTDIVWDDQKERLRWANTRLFHKAKRQIEFWAFLDKLLGGYLGCYCNKKRPKGRASEILEQVEFSWRSNCDSLLGWACPYCTTPHQTKFLSQWVIQRISPTGVYQTVWTAQGEEQRGEHTSESTGCDFPQPHLLPPVFQEMCDPLTGGGWHSELVEGLLGWWCWMPSWSQTRSLHMSLGSRDIARCSAVDCTIHWPVCPVNSRGSSRFCDVLQVGQHQSLKGFHDHRHQGDRPVVIEYCDRGCLREGDDCGMFEAGGNFTQFQLSVEDLRECGGRLVSTGFQTGEWHAVRARCLSDLLSLKELHTSSS